LRKAILPLISALLWTFAACEEQTPTSTAEGLLPVAPVTFEVLLPWSQFATGASVYGDFGVPSDRGVGVLANKFRALLDARTLGHWDSYGLDELVNDTTGTIRQDTLLRPKNARIVMRFDTLATSRDSLITVSAHRTLVDFDRKTASWTHAVDSAGNRRPWPVAGGGPAVRVGQGVWDRATSGDSLILPVDTAAIRAWSDTLASGRGFRLDVETSNVRVEVTTAELRFDLTPSVRPDTTLERAIPLTDITFIYTPKPTAPTSGLRVGGIPAWRSVIHTQIPTVLNGPAALCAALGCPFELKPERINHASLLLTTRPTDPPAFQPLDTVRIDVRSVLSPQRLPKAPLGTQFAGLNGRALDPLSFLTPTSVTIPITSFVLAQLTPDTVNVDLPPVRSLALLAFLEPSSISFVNFAGPGQPGEPRLRLIVTASPNVELP
jgi:hypothetical protein